MTQSNVGDSAPRTIKALKAAEPSSGGHKGQKGRVPTFGARQPESGPERAARLRALAGR